MTARAKYDAASAHAMALRDIAGKLRALIVALGDDGTRLAAAYREVAAAEDALADDAAKAYADVPRAPTTDADRDCVVREVRGAIAERRPCAGWVEEPRRWALPIRVRLLPWPVVYREAGSDWWAWHVGTEHGRADDMRAAQLAAEDALLAIAAEILRVVGS